MATKQVVTVVLHEFSMVDSSEEVQSSQLANHDRFMHLAARKYDPCKMDPGHS